MSNSATQERQTANPSTLPTPSTPGNALATVEQKLPAIQGAAAFELLQRAAKALSASSLVPEGYRNNVANCMIALRIADRIGTDPLIVMQNLDIIHGRPSWRAQFLIGTANSCGRFSAIRYEFFGDRNTDGWGCRAWAVEKSTDEKLVGPDITIAIAKIEGWHAKAGSKWKTIPQLMLMYRAGAWWVRAYAPELSLGFHTAEEREDIIDVTARTIQDGPLKAAAAQLGAPDPATNGEIIDAETGEVLDAEVTATEQSGDDVLNEQASDEAEGPMARGVRLLAACKSEKDVDDLWQSIADEFSPMGDEPQQVEWDRLVSARRKEVKGVKR